MRARLRNLRDIAVARLLGVELRRTLVDVKSAVEALAAGQAGIEQDLQLIKHRLDAQLEQVRSQRDDIRHLRQGLVKLRSSTEYELAMNEREPLVSVRIGSYQKTEELMDIAIASVLRQSYERFEIIVVNDGPNAATKAAIEKLGDLRIRFEETTSRGSYPANPRDRWMVAGVPNANKATSMARGTWIAPLDDDDEFTPDHLEKLVELALKNQAELAYGALVQKNLVNHEEILIWSDPPAISNFSFQGAIYLRLLTDLFRYDRRSWVVEEPADWNLVRRMMEAGVKHAATSDVVALMRHIPYSHKTIS